MLISATDLGASHEEYFIHDKHIYFTTRDAVEHSGYCRCSHYETPVVPEVVQTLAVYWFNNRWAGFDVATFLMAIFNDI